MLFFDHTIQSFTNPKDSFRFFPPNGKGPPWRPGSYLRGLLLERCFLSTCGYRHRCLHHTRDKQMPAWPRRTFRNGFNVIDVVLLKINSPL